MTPYAFAFVRRATALTLGLTLAGLAAAQSAPIVAAPYYSAEQALQGLYTHQLPPLARDFQAQADRLVETTAQHCKGQAPLPALRARAATARGRTKNRRTRLRPTSISPSCPLMARCTGAIRQVPKSWSFRTSTAATASA